MAFPTVQDSDTQANVQATNASTWTLTYPTNIVSGDLLMLFIGRDGSTGTPVLPTSWGVIVDAANGTACRLIVAFRRAGGTESGNFFYGVGASEQGVWRAIRITGAHQVNTPAVGTAATGTSSIPDPPALNPSSWDVEDTLWYAACGMDDGRTTVNLFPTSFTNGFGDASNGAGGAALGTARREEAIAAQDPNTFGLDRSVEWVAQTVGIRPAPEVPAVEGSVWPMMTLRWFR